MVQKSTLVMLVVILTALAAAPARVLPHITHAYANTKAQSLVGLPMGNHKTTVDM